MNIKCPYNRARIALNALAQNHKIKKTRKNNNRNVFIVFQQLFGDAVVLQNSLYEYVKIFPESKGYKIKLLARPSVLDFMNSVLCIPKEIEFEAVDFKRFLKDFAYYQEIIKKYQGCADILIVPGTSLSAEIFSTASDAPRKIGLVRSIEVTKPMVMAIFAKIAYTERVKPDKSDMMLQRHRQLLNYLGDTDYKAKLPMLQFREKIIHEQRYCVLSPGSSKMEKCWPTQRFAEIADFIISNYNMKVHLCGGEDEIEFEKLMISQVKHPEYVVSHIGKTNFSDWSAIVQHAEFVIGNDSATLHMAAASRRKAICITGVYDKYQFFPYKVDELEEKDRLPVTVLKDMPCQWCRTIGYDAGYGNSDCRKRILNNQCSICIDKITVEEVKGEIIKLIEGNDDEFTQSY